MLETVESILELPCVAIPGRGIKEKTAERFGIRTSVDPRDGLTQVAHYFPYTLEGKIVGFKKRDMTVPKQSKLHFSVIGFQGIQCDLFGLTACNKTGGKKVIITEGELDCAITWQVMKDKWPSANPNVMSIGNGTSNAVQNIGQKSNMKYLEKFSEIILAFDADKATPAEREKKIMKGKDAVAAVYGLLPNSGVAEFPEDYDPCDMFNENMGEQLYWAVVKSHSFTPEGFITYDQIEEQAKTPPKLGKPWPWPTMTKLTLGRRLGEGYFFGAGKL